MNNLNKITILAMLAFFILTGCNKEVITSTSKPVLHGNDFTGVDASVKDSVMVMTSFGPRLRSDVHTIPVGHRLNFAGQHLQEVDIATGKLINDFGIQAPLKYLLSNQQANAKPHTINQLNAANNNTKLTNTIVPAGPASGSWKTWAGTSDGKNGTITSLVNPSFSTTWVVPSYPTNMHDNQNFFIFNGLTAADSSNIVQPVLQFGDNGVSGASPTTWSIFSEFASCNNCGTAVTTATRVNPGDHLTGTLTLSGMPGADDYTSSFLLNGSPAANSVLSGSVAVGLPFARYYVTLEEYRVLNGGDYPTDNYVAMSTPLVKNLVADTNTTPPPSFGEHTVVTSTNEALLFFRAAPLPVPVISYPTPDAFLINTYNSLSPVNTGGPPNAYTISPTTLPAGLTFNTANGIISGTPTSAFPPTSYTISAQNRVGTGRATISLSVVTTLAPIIAYHTPHIFTTNTPITALNPTNTGGTPVSYSISPSLPSGLIIDPITGIIHGTAPGSASPPTNYTVTATNSYGSGTAPVNIAIFSPYTIIVSSTSALSTYYTLTVNGSLFSGTNRVASNNPNTIPGVIYPTTSSTVIFQYVTGTPPTSATLYPSGLAPINGIVSGSTITFTGVNLTVGTSCQIYINI